MNADPAPLTERQRQLKTAVVSRASSINEQMLLLVTQARTVGASERDVRRVRDAALRTELAQLATSSQLMSARRPDVVLNGLLGDAERAGDGLLEGHVRECRS